MAEAPRTIRLRKNANDNMPKVEAIGQTTRLHEDFYHSVLLWPWWQFFVFVCGGFLGVNAIFAALFLSEPGSIANAREGSFEDAFFFSVQTLATIGYGGMAPATLFAHIVVTIEAITGILGVALITGLTFAKFARPTARVLFSEKLVVSVRNGVPHLMFRMANWRQNMVVEAQVRVVLLVLETTEEGETMRRTMEVPLVRDRTAMFILSFTAMHEINEASPFFGPDAVERLRAQKAEIILTMSGLDEAIGQTIHARYRYALDQIVWNARFVDVLVQKPDGTRVIDYRKFHDVVEGPPAVIVGRPD